MLECHALPSCKPVCATYRTFVNNRLQDGVPVSKVVLYEQQGALESGPLGIKFNCQIAVSQLNTKPKFNDLLIIGTQAYEFVDIALMDQSPVFKAFYQCTLKTTKLNYGS